MISLFMNSALMEVLDLFQRDVYHILENGGSTSEAAEIAFKENPTKDSLPVVSAKGNLVS